MNLIVNINNSAINSVYLTICFKEFLENSQIVLNDLEKKNNNCDNFHLLESFKVNNINKTKYIKQKTEIITEKISNNNKNIKIMKYTGKDINFNDIAQIEIIFEIICKINNSIKNEMNKQIMNLIYPQFIEYNYVLFIYFYNIIKIMKINEDKKINNISQINLLEEDTIKIKENEI